MKRILSLALFCACCSFSMARFPQLSVGYFGNFAIQPGLKVGLEWEVLAWEKAFPNKEVVRTRSLRLGPELGYFAYPKFNDNLWVGGSVLLKMKKKDKSLWWGPGLGLAYRGQSEILSQSTHLGSGETQTLEREWRNHLVPTGQLSLGGRITDGLEAFGKGSLGHQIGLGREGSLIAQLEIGLKIDLGRKSFTAKH